MKKRLMIFTFLFLSGLTLLAQNVNVTFKVDMSYQVVKGVFDPGSEVVTCAGTFNNWLSEPPLNTEKIMADDDGDLIYELTIAMPAEQYYEYKFNIGLDWLGKDEFPGGGANRVFLIESEDLVLKVVSFNDEGTARRQPASVTFSVGMHMPLTQNTINQSTPVWVAGNFTDWGTSPFALEDPDGDSTYTGTFTEDFAGAPILGGDTLVFKFAWGEISNLNLEPDPDRLVYATDGDNIIFDYWDRNDPNVQIADGYINFNVNMSVMGEVGLYKAANDMIQVRGSFNGWNGGEISRSHLNQNFLDPDDWFLNVSFDQYLVNENQFYKYFVKLPGADPRLEKWPDNWERPFSSGGGNREVVFLGLESQETETVYFDDVHPDYVIPEGETVSITFSVDMNPAADPKQQVPTFKPAEDTVWWISEQPPFVYLMGWEDTDQMKELMLEDPDGDMIYTTTLDVMGPAWNGFEYRYGFSTPAGAYAQETADLGFFAYRVRYIPQSAPRTFQQPYSAPLDTWTPEENKQDQWEEGPEGLTSVSEVGKIGQTFTLEQNYPNPFNPATIIQFNIPQDNVVTLKVYNIIGEEVAELLNREIKAGSYQVSFKCRIMEQRSLFLLYSGRKFYGHKKNDTSQIGSIDKADK